MVNLAKQWKTAENRERYHQAALEFRMPYWDYYRPRGPRVNFPGVIKKGMTSFAYDYSCPIAFTVENINVRTAPDDKWTPMSNPLHHWEFEKDFVPEKDWLFAKAYVADEVRKLISVCRSRVLTIISSCTPGIGPPATHCQGGRTRILVLQRIP